MKLRLLKDRRFPREDQSLYAERRLLPDEEQLVPGDAVCVVVRMTGKKGEAYVECAGFGTWCVCAPCATRYDALVNVAPAARVSFLAAMGFSAKDAARELDVAHGSIEVAAAALATEAARPLSAQVAKRKAREEAAAASA